jgi:hypothetical protein
LRKGGGGGLGSTLDMEEGAGSHQGGATPGGGVAGSDGDSGT